MNALKALQKLAWGLPRSPEHCEATPGKPQKNLLTFAGHPPEGGRQKWAFPAG